MFARREEEEGVLLRSVAEVGLAGLVVVGASIPAVAVAVGVEAEEGVGVVEFERNIASPFTWFDVVWSVWIWALC